MDFPPPQRRAAQETLLPMINVVFLLLIFFLIAARMTPPQPFAVTPPISDAAAEALGEFTLYLGAGGELGYRDITGNAALPALLAERLAHCATVDCNTTPPRLTLRADAGLGAARLAALLPTLAELGFDGVELITARAAP